MGFPAPLGRASRIFEAWRRSPGRRRRIPDDLWELAAEAGRRYGVSRASRVLRLEYYDLKGRVEARRGAGEPVASPGFVEIGPVPGWMPIEWSIEVEGASGSKMRMHVKGGSAPDLAALRELFVERCA